MSAQKARRPRRASAAAGARGRNTSRRPTTQQRQGSLESSHPPDTPTTMLGQSLRDAGKNARASADDAQIAAHVHVLCSARGRAWALRKARRAHPLHNNTQLASHHCIQPVGIGSKVRPGLGGYERREESMRPRNHTPRVKGSAYAPRVSRVAGARARERSARRVPREQGTGGARASGSTVVSQGCSCIVATPGVPGCTTSVGAPCSVVENSALAAGSDAASAATAASARRATMAGTGV